MNLDRIVRSLMFLAFLLFSVFAAPAIAQSGSVDLTFNPVPSNPLPNDTTLRHVIQPDGKVIVYNAPSMFVNGVLRSGMFRLNTDGTTDTTFSYNNEGGVGIHSVVVAPDGKIVLAGSAAPNHAKMIRLNSDGSVDNSFSAVFITAVGPPEFTGNWLSVDAIQADGKVIATHGSWGNIMGTWYSYSMKRYNPDGSVDASFTSPALHGGHLVTTTALIEFLPDGRFYLAVTSRSHLGGSMGITRRLADGTIDSTYAAFSQTIFSSSFLSIEDISIASDGGVLATGALQQTAIGFPPREQLRRFLSDGTSAPSFASPLAMTGGVVHGLPDGKILYSASGGTITRPIIRLEANGSVDNTYALDPVITSIRNKWQVDSLNRPVFLATTSAGPRLVRLLENGSIDPTFTPVLGAPGSTSVLAVQADGKVVVAGPFSNMNATVRNKFARLNADGSTDVTFDPGTGFNSLPRKLLVQPDGKILAIGSFSNYNGTPVTYIVRINSNGSIDDTFSTTVTASNGLHSIALQSDGKILVGGQMTAINGVARKGIARLESNGALDATFDPLLGGTSPYVSGIVVEPTQKITIAGIFSGVNGVNRTNLARLEVNGSTDASLDAVGLANTHGLWSQPDGKYLIVTGQFPALSRRNSDGSADTSFAPPTTNGSVSSVVVMPDGSMVIGGDFNVVNGIQRWYVTRLARNGAHDTSFLTFGTNAPVSALASYATDKVLVAGAFSSVESVSRLGIARLNVPELRVETPFDFNGDGRADYSVYRPSTGVWYQLFSNGEPYASPTFGLAGDIPVPADFDGDGKTDVAIWRPSNGDWWYKSSITGAQITAHFGQTGDIPLPGDFDGDGKTDFIVYRPSTRVWYRMSTSIPQHEFSFGLPGDQPVIGDFDGDGKTDLAIFRPSNGDWWYAASSSSYAHRSIHWGATGDIPAPADYDGDGKTDFAVFRPSNGGWYVYRSSDQGYTIVGFGLDGDRPIPADYDGDGRADIAVFRPSTGVWYLMQSTAGIGGVQWGVATDVAVPNAFLP